MKMIIKIRHFFCWRKRYAVEEVMRNFLQIKNKYTCKCGYYFFETKLNPEYVKEKEKAALVLAEALSKAVKLDKEILPITDTTLGTTINIKLPVYPDILSQKSTH